MAVKKRFGRKKDFKVRRERDYSHQREPAISPFFRLEMLVQVEILETIAFIRGFYRVFHSPETLLLRVFSFSVGNSLGPMRRLEVGERNETLARCLSGN